jgi:hypothetical protein
MPASEIEQSPAEVPLPPFGFTPVLFIYDLVARWVVLGLWHFDYLSRTTVWFLQVLVIPALMIFTATRRETMIQTRLGLPKTARIIPPDTPVSIGAVVLTLIIGGVQIYSAINLSNAILRHASAIVAILFFFFYAVGLMLKSARLLPGEDHGQEPPENSIDANDEVIIRLETLLGSISERVNTYTLESTLFGALAFSAFVTIVVSDKARIEAVAALFQDAGLALQAVVAFNPKLFGDALTQIAHENTLFAAIAAQTLLCSAFYLAVIVCRLRFNDLVGRSDYCIRVAAEFNRKENEVEALALQFEAPPARVAGRLEELTGKISESLRFADESMNTLAPIVRYMSLFRNMGVLTFLTVLVVSALWVSHLLAIFFAALSLMAFMYPAVDRVRDRTVRHIVAFQDRYRRIVFRGLQPKPPQPGG